VNCAIFDEIAHAVHAAVVLDLHFQNLGLSFHRDPSEAANMRNSPFRQLMQVNLLPIALSICRQLGHFEVGFLILRLCEEPIKAGSLLRSQRY
jgi:hypothetical protein